MLGVREGERVGFLGGGVITNMGCRVSCPRKFMSWAGLVCSKKSEDYLLVLEEMP